MAKFLPFFGELYTAVESALKLFGAGVAYPFHSGKATELYKGAGEAWVDYANSSSAALAIQGRSEDLATQTVDFAEGLPVVGHAIGVKRYTAGDKEGGDRCMKQASRSAAVAAAIVFTGGAGAIAGGAAAVGAGLATDALTTGIDSAVHGEYRPSGVPAKVTEAVKTGDPNKVVEAILIPGNDFVAGAKAAKSQQANAKVNASKANVRVRSGSAPIKAVADAGNLGRRPRATKALPIADIGDAAEAGPFEKSTKATKDVIETLNCNYAVDSDAEYSDEKRRRDLANPTRDPKRDLVPPSHLGSWNISGGITPGIPGGICNTSAGIIERSGPTPDPMRNLVPSSHLGSWNISGGITPGIPGGICNTSAGIIERSGPTPDPMRNLVPSSHLGSWNISGGIPPETPSCQSTRDYVMFQVLSYQMGSHTSILTEIPSSHSTWDPVTPLHSKLWDIPPFNGGIPPGTLSRR